MSVPETLQELLDAGEDDRTCAERHSMSRQGCAECQRYSDKGAYAAKRTLERLGFACVRQDYPAARTVLTLTEALEDYRLRAALAQDATDFYALRQHINRTVDAALKLPELAEAMEGKG